MLDGGDGVYLREAPTVGFCFLGRSVISFAFNGSTPLGERKGSTFWGAPGFIPPAFQRKKKEKNKAIKRKYYKVKIKGENKMDTISPK